MKHPVRIYKNKDSDHMSDEIYKRISNSRWPQFDNVRIASVSEHQRHRAIYHFGRKVDD